ncbi:MAG: C1 domain-containing protein [archaeon]|nr:C1 domain-containing protein [archaeon]
MTDWQTSSYANYSNLPVRIQKDVQTRKHSALFPSPKVSFTHKFVKHSYGASMFDCALCMKTMWGSELRCSLCKMPCHTGCQAQGLRESNCNGLALNSEEWQCDIQRTKKAKDKASSSRLAGDSRGIGDFPPIREVSSAEYNAYIESSRAATPTEILRIDVVSDEMAPEHAHTLGSKTLSVKPSHTIAELESNLIEKLTAGVALDKRSVCCSSFSCRYCGHVILSDFSSSFCCYCRNSDLY